MVAGATHQQQQDASQLAPPSSTTVPTTVTEEEEFLKRNTDCVYFLASPLTCKKGSECEYRHSDIARVNPRDCWYWLNGNCLNPKCGFRHPPLDGLLGAEVATTTGPSVPQALATPSPYATPKQGVACIFFQKGFCLKGHLCPFLHGPPSTVNSKAAQPGPPNSVTKPPQIAPAGLEKSVRDQKLMQHENVEKRVEFLPPQGKQVPRVQAPAPARNGGGHGVAMEKKVPPPPAEELPRYRPASVVPPPVLNEYPSDRSNHGVYETHRVSDNDGALNGKDVDGYSREPTPGFDVLVDNELGDSEYYHNEEQFGRSSGRDFDVDQDMYSEQRDYDHYNEHDRLHGERYAWEDHRASSERMLAGAANLERKRYPRDDGPDQFAEADLRHRISKQRRGNVSGLRSVVSHEHARDSHADRAPRRDGHHHSLDLGSLSSRLRGRIKIPGRSTSPGNGNDNDLRMEREIDIGRQRRSRYSPPRRLPQASSNHSRLRDRIKGRVSEDYNEEREYRVSRWRQDVRSDNDSEFTGPKRLLELKSGKAGDGHEQSTDDRQSLGKRKYHEDNLSFEGPKPLSEIMKRKRGGAETAAADTRVSSVNDEDNNEKERKEVSCDSVSPEFVGGENEIEKDKSCLNGGVNEVGSLDEDALLDRELEAYEERDGEGEYDYEQIEGEEYNPDEEGMEGE